MSETSIPLDSKVLDRLKNYQIGDMSYSDVLTRLMDERDRDTYLRELHREADETTDWTDAQDL